MSDVSGLNLGPTIDWYAENLEALLERLPKPTCHDAAILKESGITVTRQPGVESPLSDEDIAALVARFPAKTRTRWNVVSTAFQPPLWFKKGSTSESISVTHDVTEAISPTAIVPSYIENNKGGNSAYVEKYGYQAEISLYAMDPDVVPLPIQRLILWQGLVHELVHGFVSVDIYDCREEQLLLPDGTLVGGHEYLESARDFFGGRPPISHYASTYFASDGTLPDVKFQRPLNENVTETITAMLLGFAFQMDGDGLDPFCGHVSLGAYLHQYLHAVLVS